MFEILQSSLFPRSRAVRHNGVWSDKTPLAIDEYDTMENIFPAETWFEAIRIGHEFWKEIAEHSLHC